MSRISKLLDRLPIELLLIALVVLSYWRVQRLWFVYDDAMYVFAAQQTHHGLNLPDIKWALTSIQYANWHPLTWISYMVDSQIAHGPSARQLHLTNLLIHIASMLLLFLLLNRMTKSVWKSAFVAALFGVHPLHVESVAWIAERKDVLSTFFWLATTWMYVRYTERPGLKTYLPVIGCFVLGLASKPMIVTLPFTLLLLDYWPLCRFKMGFGKLVREKIPLFVLSTASCALTYYAQSHGGAFGRASGFPLGIRLMNALYSYIMYIWKTIWPVKLAAFYPHPGYHLAAWVVAACGLLLVAITVLVLRAGRKHPYLPMGWLWYLGTLIPVIGIIQVGQQGMADRYTYVPILGLFIMIAWGIPELLGQGDTATGRYGDGAKAQVPTASSDEGSPSTINHQPSTIPSIALGMVAVVLVIGLGVMTRIQVRYWRDNYMLFGHAIQVTKNNFEAYGNYGAVLQQMGDCKGALKQYQTAVKIQPDVAPMRYNLGRAYMGLGMDKQAEEQFRIALKLDPKYAPAHNNLATILIKQGKLDDAFQHLDEAVSLEPNYADAYTNYGNLLDMVGREDEALARYDDAIAVAAWSDGAHYNKAILLYKLGRVPEAIAEYKEAIRYNPSNGSAHNNLAMAYLANGQYEDAWKEVHLAVRYGRKPHPGFLEALSAQMPDPFE